jgi:2,4-dienoyl-CoA reductase-like NADH-dependent reductase (Old Yellow Enzyme family)
MPAAGRGAVLAGSVAARQRRVALSETSHACPTDLVATWPQSLAPLRIGGATIRNRLGLGPINSALFEDDGSISDLHLEFYDRLAHEGLGLLYVGGVAVCAPGRSNRGSLVLDSRVRSYGIARVAEVCHRAGAALVVQLMHAGRQTRSAETGHAISAPSAIPCPVVGELPRALSRDEIQLICRRFGEAAALAEEAGADLVEIHGAHGYLVGGFLSPYSNLRRDDYRAIVGGHSRFLAELLDEVARRTSLPIGLRVSVVENVAGGLRLEDLVRTLRQVDGGLAFLSVSGGVYVREHDVIISSRRLRHLLWERQAAALRRSFAIPVLLAGNAHGLGEVERIVAEGSADAVLMVRALLADPGLLSKWLAGRARDVRACTDCQLCKYHSRGQPHVFCPLKPELVAIRRHWLRSARRRGLPT